MTEEHQHPFPYSSYFVNSVGFKIACKYWEPQSPPRGLVFISHGFAEHCLIYDALAKLLASRNFFAFSHDHMGHGHSEGPRGHVDKFEYYVQDVFHHCELMTKKLPNLPMFAVGHSMGGTVCILANLKRPNYFNGVALIGPAVMPNPKTATTFKVTLVRLLGKVFTSFPIAYVDYSLACSSSKQVRMMKKDPLYYHGFCKAGFLINFLHAVEEVQSRLNSTDFPFLILHGEKDKLCDIRGAQAMYEQSPSKDKTIKIYPKAYHCLLQEPNGVAEDALEEIAQWLETKD